MNPIGVYGRDLDLSPLIVRKRRVLSRSRLISSFDIILDNLFYEFLNRAMLYI